jgi:hypothetical protein
MSTKLNPKNTSYLDRWDDYKVPVNGFNFEGRKSIHTNVGVVCSTIGNIFIIYFFCTLSINLMTGDSPVTNTITMLDVHTTEEGAIDLDEQGFFFAFGVKNYQKGDFRHDPNMV